MWETTTQSSDASSVKKNKKKNTEPNLREQEQKNMTTINGKIVIWELFLESLNNRSVIDKRTTAYKDTGKEKQGWKPLRQYWIFRHPN